MKWILFTGTWRLTNKEVEADVRKAVQEVFSCGNGIVTGGGTGVDYFAMHEAMKIDPSASRLKVIIPSKLKHFIDDYCANWCLEPITKNDINYLEKLLEIMRTANPSSLIEMQSDVITQEIFYLRDTEEVKISDEVYAFQVNGSLGTQDTIDKALKLGLPISIHKKYTI